MSKSIQTPEHLLAEIERQLALKPEITSIGPPHVAVNGEEVRTVLAELRAQRDELLAILKEINDRDLLNVLTTNEAKHTRVRALRDNDIPAAIARAEGRKS